MSVPLSRERVVAAYQTARTALLNERHTDGHWNGELSASALSTATAVSALGLVQRCDSDSGPFDPLISAGINWLAQHQNVDGGWGDTKASVSNISTSMLVNAAFHLTGHTHLHRTCLSRLETYLQQNGGKSPAERAATIRFRYGKDRTFAVPILTTCALAGQVSWQEVAPLPFELACLPQSWFRFLNLPVVSYALPALIAIGQAVFAHRPPWNPVVRFLRRMAQTPSLRVLGSIQPSSGGFLEATPLTSFVTLSLASTGHARHPVARKGIEFLVRSARPDGSWPIDTNLATWVTTLSINALAAAGDLSILDERSRLVEWLLRQQFTVPHPYTGAAPGGWGWTDLPGSVPDADDTPGALLALAHLTNEKQANKTIQRAVHLGLQWLIDLQNRDGGWPTFCRGWGHLPFDRSGADLSAHALRAFSAWERYCAGSSWTANKAAIRRGMQYLARTQRQDGSWVPLWFGNQHSPDDENPTYGTARVLAAYRDLDMMNSKSASRAIAWLLKGQLADGGWNGGAGGPASIEETALAVEVLLDTGPTSHESVNRGLSWLVQRVESGGLLQPAPIGFYFAKLWYFEKLYPIIFTTSTLGRACRMYARRQPHDLHFRTS